MEHQELLDRIVAASNMNRALKSELHGVLDQVDQYLFDTTLISDKLWQSRLLIPHVTLELAETVLVDSVGRHEEVRGVGGQLDAFHRGLRLEDAFNDL